MDRLGLFGKQEVVNFNPFHTLPAYWAVVLWAGGFLLPVCRYSKTPSNQQPGKFLAIREELRELNISGLPKPRIDRHGDFA